MREKKLKRAAETVRAPQSQAEVEAMLARLGAIQRDRTVLATALEETLAKERERVNAEDLPLRTEVDTLVRGIQLWADANRPSLTMEGRHKTVRLANGEIAWRIRPPSVTLRGVEVVLEYPAQKGMKKFIREKKEVNKEAMLADIALARTVPGVTIGSQGEEFVVSPLTEQVVA